ncbi:MAG: lytic murein transglycosylase [Novosphingobium sp.]
MPLRFIFRRLARPVLGLAVALAGAAPTTAQFPATTPAWVGQPSFPAYLQLLAARARAEGVSDTTITTAIAGLTFNQRVIDLDRAQPGGLPTAAPSGSFEPFEPYRRTHVDAARIAGGRRQYAAIAGRAAGLEQRYGVPVPVLLAIFGHESNYGSYTGDFDLARSLASLAYEGRRRELFAQEFIALLKMIDRGVPRYRLKGSWAGAFGNPQFLPSVYLRVAADGDGDGVADIWNSEADTLASIGNYFRDAGWRRGEPWGVAVSVPAGLDRGGLAARVTSPRCPRVHARHTAWKTMAEWRALGIVPRSGGWPRDTMLATLIEPDGPGKTAYLLTGNYRVILDYNCSNYYALSVGLLADAIAS